MQNQENDNFVFGKMDYVSMIARLEKCESNEVSVQAKVFEIEKKLKTMGGSLPNI